ncbi:integrase core domain [Paramuricea clavata]|uniref:Integrase core domain, partial n=1 Tax=Paramuricea clavata TaxID=317549 RepID=A0A7D9HK03_PARCT|nr:integrase core domain [Paramuricea clavata]
MEVRAQRIGKRPCLFSTAIHNVVDVQLYGFSDASPKAYGAVSYLRLQDCMGNVVVHILIAKSRVAPTRRVMLPRLELMSKLVQFVLNSLKTKIMQYFCWSDSMVTLGWIRRLSYSWKPFVVNRLQTIQENVAPVHWRFCPGESNPADLLTRGQSLQSLTNNSVWWHGPEWLCEFMEKWPTEVLSEESDDLPESKQIRSVTLHSQSCYRRVLKHADGQSYSTGVKSRLSVQDDIL